MQQIVLLQELANTPRIIADQANQIPRELIHQSAAVDQWSLATILTHLIETEVRYRTGIHTTVNRPRPYQHQRESAITEPQVDKRITLPELLNHLTEQRQITLAYLRTLEPMAWQLKLILEPVGEMDLQSFVQQLLLHDREHIHQLRKLAQIQATQTPAARAH